MSDRTVRISARTAWLALVAACALVSPQGRAAERVQPAGPPPQSLPALPALVDTDPLAIETVRFADPSRGPVRVIRGLRPTPAAPITPPLNAEAIPAPRKEIVAFGGHAADQVVVVRGAEGLPAGLAHMIPAGTSARVERVAFSDKGTVNVVRGETSRPERADMSFTIGPIPPAPTGLFDAANGGELDRVAFAVDGVESRHGADARMWRPEFGGPQGPMQVSAAAAFDVGGGDRFDVTQNRLLGRAYLAQMFQRYGNWPDAIAAYNWGPGNMDQWIGVGRPLERLPIGVVRYTNRVLRDALVVAGARL